MEKHNNFFILTGGPGSGKTTLLQALHHHGYKTMSEAGRAIIQQQTAINGDALPHKNPPLFATAMMEWDLQNYQKAKSFKSAVFFDRGLPDNIGYLSLMSLPTPHPLKNAAQNYRYNPFVFLAPFWEDIYKQDNERLQSLEEAEKTATMMQKTYETLGYKIIILPKCSVENRIAFITNEIMRLNNLPPF